MGSAFETSLHIKFLKKAYTGNSEGADTFLFAEYLFTKYGFLVPHKLMVNGNEPKPQELGISAVKTGDKNWRQVMCLFNTIKYIYLKSMILAWIFFNRFAHILADYVVISLYKS